MAWTLAAKPYEVQDIAFNSAKDRLKYGYFMEQGLGKTATLYADYLYQLIAGKVDALLLFCPNYLKTGWEDEAALWGIKQPVYLWPDRPPEGKLREAHVQVINYEAIREGNQGSHYLEAILGKKVRYMLALDESGAIKNFQSAQCKAIFRLRMADSVCRELNGMPMTQNIMDLYPQLRFLGEIHGMNPYVFKNRYAKTGGYMGKQVVDVQPEFLHEIHKMLDRCGFRALKEDWWDDMPEKLYPVPLEFDLGKKQKELYESMLQEFYAYVDTKAETEGTDVFAEQVITMQMKLQQISRGFIFDNEKDVHWIVDPKTNPALQTLKAARAKTRGKCIILAHFRPSVDMLIEQFPGCAFLRGDMTDAEIKENKFRFNNDPKCRDLIGQLSVAQKGHTLLGQAGEDRCSTTLYYENTYNLEVRKQSEDRNHRWGQDKAVTYIDFYCCHMDKKMTEALQKKEGLAKAVVDVARRRPKGKAKK